MVLSFSSSQGWQHTPFIADVASNMVADAMLGESGGVENDHGGAIRSRSKRRWGMQKTSFWLGVKIICLSVDITYRHIIGTMATATLPLPAVCTVHFSDHF